MIAKLASSGTVIGTLIPGAILVIMGIVYLAQGNHSAAPMKPPHRCPPGPGWRPRADRQQLPRVLRHGDERGPRGRMKNPAASIPKSIFLAMILVLAIFIVPALVISWVVPASQQISLTAGVMQAFSAFFAHFGLTWMVPLVAIAMVVAMLSGMMAWLAARRRGCSRSAGNTATCPPYFQKLNEEGIQMNILVAQGIVVTIIGLLYAFIPDVSSAYWIFSVMTTQVYLIMYVLMFIAAVMLAPQQPDHPRGYRAPAAGAQCVVGALASVLAFLIGFVPPSQFASRAPSSTPC